MFNRAGRDGLCGPERVSTCATGRWAPAARLITFLIACTWVGVSAVLAFAPPFRAQWFRSRDVIEAEFLLAKQSSLCGILLYDYPWWETGGYAHLHRNVPFYELPEQE